MKIEIYPLVVLEGTKSEVKESAELCAFGASEGRILLMLLLASGSCWQSLAALQPIDGALQSPPHLRVTFSSAIFSPFLFLLNRDTLSLLDLGPT